MLELHEDQGEVVDEQQRVDHGGRVLDDVVVLDPAPLLVKHPHPIKQPEGKDEHEEEGADTSSKQVDPRHRGLRLPEEERPRAEQ